MKCVVLALTLLLCGTGRAEEANLDDRLDMAKAELGAGVALVLVATALGAAGGGMLAVDHTDRTDDTAGKRGALSLGVSGAILAVIGLPLAILGGRKLRRLRKQSLAVGPTSLNVSF